MNMKLAIALTTLPLVAVVSAARGPSSQETGERVPVPIQNSMDPVLTPCAPTCGELAIRLVDEQGRTLRSAEIELKRLDDGWDSVWPFAPRLESDHFLIPQLLPGRYKIEAMNEWPSHSAKFFVIGYADVAAGVKTTVTLSKAHQQPCEVSGTVVRGEQRVPDAEVTAHLWVWPQPLHARVKTDHKGQFVLVLPRAGRWLLQTRLPGWEVSGRGWNIALDHHLVRDVPSGGITDVHIAIPGGRIAGVVRASDGTTISGHAVGLGSDSVWDHGSRTLTDSNGRFEFRDLALGTYRLEAHPANHVVKLGALVCRSAEITAASPHDDDADMQASAPGQLSCQIDAPPGCVLGSEHVYARSAAWPNGSWFILGGTRGSGHVTSPGLNYVDGLPAGPLELAVRAQSSGLATPTGAFVNIVPGERATLRLSLEQATSVSIRAQGADGTPAFVRLVELLSTTGQRVFINGPEGEDLPLIRLRPLTAGKYTLRVADTAGSIHEQTIKLDGEPERDVLFQL